MLFSCENTSDDKVSSDLSDIQIIELAESFDQDEESLTDDMDDAFSSFDSQFSVSSDILAKGSNPGTYDDSTGFWTRIHQGTRSRIDSITRNDLKVIRDMNITFDKVIEMRFSDIDNATIKHARNNKDAITKIEMIANGTFSAEGSVLVYDADGNLISEASESSTHTDKDVSTVLEKIDTEGFATFDFSYNAEIDYISKPSQAL